MMKIMFLFQFFSNFDLLCFIRGDLRSSLVSFDLIYTHIPFPEGKIAHKPGVQQGTPKPHCKNRRKMVNFQLTSPVNLSCKYTRSRAFTQFVCD